MIKIYTRFGKTRKGNICKVFNKRLYSLRNTKNGLIYTAINYPYNTLAHSIWEYLSGERVPHGWCIVHIDGDSKNDSPYNLKILTREQASSRWQTFYNTKNNKELIDIFRQDSYKLKPTFDELMHPPERHSKGYWENHSEERKARQRGYYNNNKNSIRQNRQLRQWKHANIW